MKKLWPELLVLVLFLLGDLLWDGLASAAAGAGAGILAFLILLSVNKKKPGLIVEGLVFGGITALGELVDYPGGTIILMELVLAVILLVSVISGKDIISRMAGGIGRGFFSKRQSRILSMTLGSVFLGHSLLCTALILLGNFSWWAGAVFFVVMYLLALRISKPGMRNAVQYLLPELSEENDGLYRIGTGEVTAGKIRLADEIGTAVTAEIISIEIKPHEFIKQLETVLRRRGIRSLAIDSWAGDEIELEMQGYVVLNGKWRKRI